MLSFVTLLSFALACAKALVVPQEDSSALDKREPAPIKLDFDIRKTLNKSSDIIDISERAHALKSRYNRKKRATSSPIVNDNDISYLLDVKLGSNKQPVTVELDTGSSDLWVYNVSTPGAQGGSFDPSKSSDDKDTGKAFSISYLDGSGAEGEYVTDDFAFADGKTLLEDFRFAVVDGGEPNSEGVLGVGNKNTEAVSSHYDNLPWAFQKKGITPKASYSLFLGSEESGKGSIIFGGIDTEKYEGELTKYPVSGSDGLALEVKSAEVDGKSVALNKPFLLDSGTSLNLWPSPLINAVGKALGGLYCFEFYCISCDQPKDKFLTFDFGNNKINVSYHDLVFHLSESECVLGVQPNEETFILGDVFLRSAYVYYDLTSDEISIAQAKYTNASNIVSA
ncbi:hypothetical protein FDK38_000005 [Candidozyma auris]|nr:hypothetical protein FDK38_000005 [[Candida] auris]